MYVDQQWKYLFHIVSPGLEKNSNKDKVFVDDLESIGILLTSAKNMRIDYLKHKQVINYMFVTDI